MMDKIEKNRENQQGFTLLELLLVVGLAAIMIVSFGRLSTLWANRELGDLSGIHMQRVAEVTENYIRANVATGALASGGDITTEISDALPAGMTMRNPLRRDVQVELIVNANEYQAVIYTTDASIPFDRLLPAARAGGASGGVLKNVAGSATVAESAFGLWTVDVSAIADMGTVDDDGGQLVSYIAMSFEEGYGAYLYRQDMDAIASRPDLNTMFADLNMNGNSIRAADAVEVNDMDIYNTASIGQLTVNGDTTFAGSVNISGDTNVGDQMTVNNDLTVNNGDVVVSNAINANSMDVNTANATTVNAPNISATGLDVTADTVLSSDLSITGTVDIEISGELQANTVNANTLNAQDVTTDQMTVNNNMTIDGDATIAGSAVMDVLAVEDCVTIVGDPNSPYGQNC